MLFWYSHIYNLYLLYMRILFILILILNNQQLFAQNNSAGLKKVPLHYRYTSTDKNSQEVKYFSEIKNKYENDLLKEKSEYYKDFMDSSKQLTYYYYDNNKYITETVYKVYWENIKKYYNRERVRYYYTNNYKNVLQFWENGAFADNIWYPRNKYYLNKDDFGNVTLDGYENYDIDSNSWSGSFTKSIYNYKVNTNLILTRIDSFTFELNKFSPRYKWINQYDSLGRITKSENYIFYPSSWNLSTKTFFSYTADNKEPSSIKTFAYNLENIAMYSVLIADSLRWNWYDKSSMMDAYYIRNGQYKPINSYQLKRYDYLDSAIKVESKQKLSYLDANGSNVKEMFDTLNNNFIPTFRIYSMYNGNKNLTEVYINKYIASTNTWNLVDSDYYINLYNPDLTLKEITYTYSNFNIKEEYLDYIEINTGMFTSKNTLEVKLFPNPSADGKVSVNVKMEAASALSIKITDLKGSVVYTDTKELGKGLNTVELSGLQHGLYVVEMSTEYGVARTKLVIN